MDAVFQKPGRNGHQKIITYNDSCTHGIQLLIQRMSFPDNAPIIKGDIQQGEESNQISQDIIYGINHAEIEQS